MEEWMRFLTSVNTMRGQGIIRVVVVVFVQLVIQRSAVLFAFQIPHLQPLWGDNQWSGDDPRLRVHRGVHLGEREAAGL